jgi:hypothetical protein
MSCGTATSWSSASTPEVRRIRMPNRPVTTLTRPVYDVRQRTRRRRRARARGRSAGQRMGEGFPRQRSSRLSPVGSFFTRPRGGLPSRNRRLRAQRRGVAELSLRTRRAGGMKAGGTAPADDLTSSSTGTSPPRFSYRRRRFVRLTSSERSAAARSSPRILVRPTWGDATRSFRHRAAGYRLPG